MRVGLGGSCAPRVAARPGRAAGRRLRAGTGRVQIDDPAGCFAAEPRGASVAFDTIDGPPPGQFRKLVQDLNSEAQSRRLAVMSRESPSAYRVRGYIAAKQANGHTTISWVWDVFDRDQHRALRINGEETVKGKHRDAWAAADDAMLAASPAAA